jgi:hypothetical protein
MPLLLLLDSTLCDDILGVDGVDGDDGDGVVNSENIIVSASQ